MLLYFEMFCILNVRTNRKTNMSCKGTTRTLFYKATLLILIHESAMLYQLSYEATHWERGHGFESHRYRGGDGFESR